MCPRSCFRYRGTSECTFVPAFGAWQNVPSFRFLVPGNIRQNHSFGNHPFSEKNQRATAKGQNRFGTFSHFFTVFHTVYCFTLFRNFSPRACLEIKAFFQRIKKAKPFCTLVVARLSSIHCELEKGLAVGVLLSLQVSKKEQSQLPSEPQQQTQQNGQSHKEAGGPALALASRGSWWGARIRQEKGAQTQTFGSGHLSRGNRRDKLKGTNGANFAVFWFADFRFSWELQHFRGAEFRRKPQETADFRRKPQETSEFCRNPFCQFSLSLLLPRSNLLMGQGSSMWRDGGQKVSVCPSKPRVMKLFDGISDPISWDFASTRPRATSTTQVHIWCDICTALMLSRFCLAEWKRCFRCDI